MRNARTRASAALVVGLLAVIVISAGMGCTHRKEIDPMPPIWPNPDLFGFSGPPHAVVVEFTSTEF